MAKSVIVKLTDDFDGSDADETISFALDGKSYEIDLSKKNAAELRRAFKPFIDAGRVVGRKGSRGRGSSAAVSATRFSQLDSQEKERFRAWAKLPDARRISDSRVDEWIEAGKP